jgi:hypothetical protein
VPYRSERYRFDRTFVGATARGLLVDGGAAGEAGVAIRRALAMPPSFVLLDRVVWGVSSLLGKLGAEGPWRGILREYRERDAPPATELGEQEVRWLRAAGAR